jgi:hypothetical protein
VNARNATKTDSLVSWRALAVAGLASCALCLLPGCPEQANVTVTIKPFTAAAEAGAGSEATAPTEAKGYGSLVGTVTFTGTAKQLPPLIAVGDAKVKPEDKAVCAAAPIPDESLEVNPDPANKGIANVVIFLEKRPANIKPELAKPPTEPVFFDQEGCHFLPHVLVVQAGQPLLVVSNDAIPHNTHTKPARNNEFNSVIKPKDRVGTPCTYKKPEAAPISVICDLHSWMKAYHFPVDHPYFAVTDKNGKFKIEGLPAGKHLFNVWHERGPGESHFLKRKMQITIDVDKPTVNDMTFGAADLAALPRTPQRRIAYEQLLDGGEIVVTQTEGQK